MICERVSAVRCLGLSSGMTRSSVRTTSRSHEGLSDHTKVCGELKSQRCWASKMNKQINKTVTALFRSLELSCLDETRCE